MIYLFWIFFTWLLGNALGTALPVLEPHQARQEVQEPTPLQDVQPPDEGVPSPLPPVVSTRLGLPTAHEVTVTFVSSTFTSTVPSSTTTLTRTSTSPPSFTQTTTVISGTTVIAETIQTVLRSESLTQAPQALATGPAEADSNGATGLLEWKGGINVQLAGTLLLGLLLANISW
ncbi:hypothetical protein D9756_007897 [Leucocoprinus leucothites]|uniref:Uncharacterized protein n=1 Tax=Leucocoprinus leucothites TaxID=201217 RepID=A0A8H5D6Q2_9AGAR|nr:hypothetical protein D9756_007897 [Leucoagaricus leucothites]